MHNSGYFHPEQASDAGLARHLDHFLSVVALTSVHANLIKEAAKRFAARDPGYTDSSTVNVGGPIFDKVVSVAADKVVRLYPEAPAPLQDGERKLVHASGATILIKPDGTIIVGKREGKSAWRPYHWNDVPPSGNFLVRFSSTNNLATLVYVGTSSGDRCLRRVADGQKVAVYDDTEWALLPE